MKDDTDIIWLETVDSTNEEVKRRGPSLRNMAVVAARDQTAGKGQRGNKWLVEPGANLTFSMLLRFGCGALPVLHAREQFAISEAASMAVVEHLSAAGLDAAIKWPNDVYVKDRKICGMLVENALEGGCIVTSIVGIGLNVMQTLFPPMLQNPTSMACETGRGFDLEQELAGLSARLRSHLQEGLRDEASRRGLKASYEASLYRKGVAYEYDDILCGGRFKGKILGVSDEGRLLVSDDKGIVREFSFKEVSYVI